MSNRYLQEATALIRDQQGSRGPIWMCGEQLLEMITPDEAATKLVLDDLIGRNCIVHISHFTGDDGVTRECIYYVATSKVTPYIGEAPDGSDIIPDEELNDDPLPF